MTSHEAFWQLETASEFRFVDSIFRRRFPEAYEVLSKSLEEADPLELVYPGNPGEYNGIVREIITLLAPANADLGRLSREELEQVLRSGLARGYGEPPDEERLQEAVKLIMSRRDATAG